MFQTLYLINKFSIIVYLYTIVVVISTIRFKLVKPEPLIDVIGIIAKFLLSNTFITFPALYYKNVHVIRASAPL